MNVKFSVVYIPLYAHCEMNRIEKNLEIRQ